LLGAILVFVFRALGKNPETSMSQALTMVAAASQTARAAHPDLSDSQPSSDSSRATRTPVATSSAPDSLIPQPAYIPSLQVIFTATHVAGAPAVPAVIENTDQNNGQGAAPPPIFDSSGGYRIRPTYTPRPTATTRPPDPPTSVFTPTATPNPGLPGLTMNDVINRFRNDKGYTCAQGGSTPIVILWMCDIQVGNDLWYHIDLYGGSNGGLTHLLASVFQTYPDDAKAIDMLGYVATLPYTGSDAAAARQWVTQTLPEVQSVTDVREKFIGSVRFKLYGGPQGRYLEIGDPIQQ
jgi:hypothetical protein